MDGQSPDLEFEPLDITAVVEIEAWVYSDTGGRLNMTPYRESHLADPDHLKGPGGCDGYAVRRGGELFGLFEYTFPNGEMEIGLALSPRFKGRGDGADFVRAGIAHGVSRYGYRGSRVLLRVNVANMAARRVYEKVGFLADGREGEVIRMHLELGSG